MRNSFTQHLLSTRPCLAWRSGGDAMVYAPLLKIKNRRSKE